MWEDAIIRTFFRMIHEECIKNRYCEDCPFLRGKCIIYDDSPNEWKLDLINEAIQELRKKMEV